MAKLGDIVEKVRAKNAGPFWLTLDIFCGSDTAFDRVSSGLSTDRVAQLFQADATQIKRFDIAPLRVVKFSLPRPVVQGMAADRDMHGAAWAALLTEAEIN